MVVDVHLRVAGVEAVVSTCLVVERHILCRAQILRECLGHVEAGVGVGLDLQAVNLAALRRDEDGTLSTLGAVEHHCLCTLEEGDLLNLGRQHVVRRALHAIDNHERQVAVVVVVEALVVHTPQVVAVPSANKSVEVFEAAHRVVLLLQLLHVDPRDAAENMVGILVAESNMYFLFHHGRISLVSCLSAGRKRCCRQHGKEEYVCFYLFHKIVHFQFSIFLF